jgi:hypothetical protein
MDGEPCISAARHSDGWRVYLSYGRDSRPATAEESAWLDLQDCDIDIDGRDHVTLR